MWCFSKTTCEERRTVDQSAGVRYRDNLVTNSKYTWFTFLPLNLWEQFHRPLNLYFLLVAALQFIPSIAPVSPFSTVGPLALAFSITAAKEGYDDVQRHRQDRRDNLRVYRRLRRDNGEEEEVLSKDIRVGDLLVLTMQDMLPCDAVALLSSNGDGSVLLSTENLDGESDAKEKVAALSDAWRKVRGIDGAHSADSTIALHEAQQFVLSSSVVIDSESPNKDLNTYDGSLKRANDSAQGLTLDNFLPSTSVVRTTHFVIAMVVFTGNETKVGMTKRFPPIKLSLLDRDCTRYAKGVFAFQFFLVALFSVIGDFATKNEGPAHWYLVYQVEPPDLLFYVLIHPLRYFLLATIMVPISFKVTVDVSKAYVSKVMEWDHGMYSASRQLFCKVNNSALAEDLGQVEYVLTDKTGTLTENKMKFRILMTHEGHVHTLEDNTLQAVGARCQSDWRTLRLVHCLTLCNTAERVVPHATTPGPPDTDSSMATKDDTIWTSPSPDEIALVAGAARCGCRLMDRTRHQATAILDSVESTFDIVYVIKFTSQRGRMSVLVREGDGRHVVLCKGSDERVLPLCTASEVDSVIGRRLAEFASSGLRTLVYGARELDGQFVEGWLARVRLVEAGHSASVKATDLGRLFEEVEQQMHFVGASAVEDELQPLVKATIDKLRVANVKVWMLTGDKVETAKQIAATSGLLTSRDTVFDIACHQSTVEDQIEALATTLRDIEQRLAIASPDVKHRVKPTHDHTSVKDLTNEITRADEYSAVFVDSVVKAGATRQSPAGDGSSKSMKSEETLGLLQRESEAALYGNSDDYCVVITGRTLELCESPEGEAWRASLQRCLLGAATVVCCRTTPIQKASIVRLVKQAEKMTLAIGDGGNDVAMIQEAHVGVGVEGLEGRQAALAADFAVARFHFVLRLLLVHGHTAYQRTAYIVQQSFYKSMIIAWVQLLFNLSTLYSGISFWNSFSLTMWNGCYTVPLTLLYVTDIPLQPNVLLKIGSLYRISQKGRYMNAPTFFLFVVRGIAQGSLAYWLCCSALGPQSILSEGRTIDLQSHFIAPYTGALILVGFTVLLESHSFFSLQWLGLVGGIAAFVLTFFVYSDWFSSLDFYQVYNVLLANRAYYLVSFAIFAACILPQAVLAGLKFWYWPSPLQLQRGFHKRISRLVNSTLRDQFPEDNPSTFWGSLVPCGCCSEVELKPSHYQRHLSTIS